MHVYAQKFPISMYCPPTDQMSMNSELLAQGLFEALLSSIKTASLARGVGSCNHQHPRDEVSGVEETAVACKPLTPPRPCLPPERVYIALSRCVL